MRRSEPSGASKSTLQLNTAELDFDIQASPWATLKLKLEYVDGTNLLFPSTRGFDAGVDRFNLDTAEISIGDVVPLRGTIYPGNWEFVVRAIYDGKEAKTDTSQFFFRWDYLNETLKKTIPRRANTVGVLVVGVRDADQVARVAAEIDRTFANSLAETLTETEKAFQLGFVAMTEAIVVAIRIVSFLVIFIIMAVMANTMAMTARERMPEYATMKALGFGPLSVVILIFGESLAIAMGGAGLGMLATPPVAHWFAAKMGTLFPVFAVSWETFAMQAAAAIVVGTIAALLPGYRAARVRIVDGLRNIG